MAADGYDKLWVQKNLNTHATNRALEVIQATGRALPCTVIAVEGSLVTVNFEVDIPYNADDGTSGTFTLPPLQLPKAESQWLRAPTQIGDPGLTVPADTLLAGVSGLGAGRANLGVDYGNLAALVWVPVANVAFLPNPNPNQAWVNGPAGAVLSDTARTAVVTTALNLLTAIVGDPVGGAVLTMTPVLFSITVGGPEGAGIVITPNGITVTVGGTVVWQFTETGMFFPGSALISAATQLTIAAGGENWTFTAAGLTPPTGVVVETHVHGGVTSGSSETAAPETP